MLAHIVNTGRTVRLKNDRKDFANKVVMRFASARVAILLTLCTVLNFAIGTASAYLAPTGFGVKFAAGAFSLLVFAAVAAIQSAGGNKVGV
jgi:hypothetical protein